MATYRVTVSRSEVHFVDAQSLPAAVDEGMRLAQFKARPAYHMDPVADAEEVADTEPVTKMRKRIAAAQRDEEQEESCNRIN